MADCHLKRCTKCSADKPLSEFARDSQKRNGLRSHCRACDAARARRYKQENPDRVKASARRFREVHREKSVAIIRRWRERNRDKVRATQRRWVKAHPRRAYELTRSYRERNRDRERATAAARRKHNPAKFKLERARRRLRLRDAGPEAPPEAIYELLRLQRGKCAACRKNIRSCYTLDHIVPVSKGGTNARSNLQLMCHACNSAKCNRDAEDFMRRRGFLL